MNKYLRGFINSIIGLAIGFVGLLFSISILAVGFIFYPDIMTRTDRILIGHQSLSSIGIFDGVLDGMVLFVIGCVPLSFLLATLALAVFSMFLTIKLIKGFYIERIIGVMGKAAKSGTKKKKEEG